MGRCALEKSPAEIAGDRCAAGESGGGKVGDDGWVPVGSERETAASRGESGLSARAGGVPVWRARLVSGAERRSACGERSARLRREASWAGVRMRG